MLSAHFRVILIVGFLSAIAGAADEKSAVKMTVLQVANSRGNGSVTIAAKSINV